MTWGNLFSHWRSITKQKRESQKREIKKPQYLDMWQPKFTFKIHNKAKSLTRDRKRETRKKKTKGKIEMKKRKKNKRKKREKEKKRNVDSIKLCHVETTCAPYSD